MYSRLIKRAADMVAAILLLMLFAPLVFVLVIAVRIALGSPGIFTQTRVGLNDRTFLFYKFRTMTNQCDTRGNLLPDAERLTPFGRFLRASSLDELPQLWNVVKGDMSLVGPRPLLPEYLPRYSAFQRRRHEVKPGITGWTQVNGRNALSWEEKFKLDVWYVDHLSFMVDLRILRMTLASVLLRRGISRQDHATMPVFTGTPESN